MFPEIICDLCDSPNIWFELEMSSLTLVDSVELYLSGGQHAVVKWVDRAQTAPTSVQSPNSSPSVSKCFKSFSSRWARPLRRLPSNLSWPSMQMWSKWQVLADPFSFLSCLSPSRWSNGTWGKCKWTRSGAPNHVRSCRMLCCKS